jgi:hypothetical protein
MSLFEFELFPVESIKPWGTPGGRELSWFALSEGVFRIPVGDDVLFRYSPALLSHRRIEGDSPQRDADYQVAAFARDTLGSVAAGTARLPPLFEHLAIDPELRGRLRRRSTDWAARSKEDAARSYAAWRWLGERSPWMGYLSACPDFSFTRVGDHVHIAWDNTQAEIDGLRAWSADLGVHVVPLGDFLAECRDFADRLLANMEARLTTVETGAARTQIPVSIDDLRRQHATWKREFESYFREHHPDVAWPDAEAALRDIAREAAVPLPRPVPL